MLEHGGRLRASAKQFDIPLSDWMDLSTGIAPNPYPVPELPAEVWQRLPEEGDGLEAAAQAYYGTSRLLAVPGSQAAIQLLPRLRSPGKIIVLSPTYAEYEAAWTAAGHAVVESSSAELLTHCATADVVMIGNPNNPTGERFSRVELDAMAVKLKARGGWLIVDEAFGDVDASDSLAAEAGGERLSNVIVLRSIGKFFGLAGARVGFAIAAEVILKPLAEAVGPWAVAHPARVVARAALSDRDWQKQQAARLLTDSQRLHALLIDVGLKQTTGTALFSYAETGEAKAMFEFFARRGILLRLFDRPAAVRFGLPANDAEWARLKVAFDQWRRK